MKSMLDVHLKVAQKTLVTVLNMLDKTHKMLSDKRDTGFDFLLTTLRTAQNLYDMVTRVFDEIENYPESAYIDFSIENDLAKLIGLADGLFDKKNTMDVSDMKYSLMASIAGISEKCQDISAEIISIQNDRSPNNKMSNQQQLYNYLNDNGLAPSDIVHEGDYSWDISWEYPNSFNENKIVKRLNDMGLKPFDVEWYDLEEDGEFISTLYVTVWFYGMSKDGELLDKNLEIA